MTALQLKLCDIQGRLFELFGQTGFDCEYLVKTFMCSSLAKDLDSEYNRMQWAGEEYLLEELLAQSKAEKSNKAPPSSEVLFWMGYLYRYWHYYTGEDSAKIYRLAPYERMNVNYLMFHTMAPELAIEDLKEIAKQKKN